MQLEDDNKKKNDFDNKITDLENLDLHSLPRKTEEE